MRKNKLFAAAAAAALTITAIPSYTVNKAPVLMPAYAIDAEESVTVDGVVYICCGDHAIATDTENAAGEITIAAAVSTGNGEIPVTAIADGVLRGLTAIRFDGSTDEWNSISGGQLIPEGTALYCKDSETGEYVRACTVTVSFTDLDGEPVSGINASVDFHSENPYTAAQWVSGDGPVTVAVPMPEGEGQYTISHDAMSDYFVYTDTSSGIPFSGENTSYSKTVYVDDENIVPYDCLQKDTALITEGESMIVCIPGEEVCLGGEDNGVMSYKLLRSTKEEAVYRLTARKPGSFELIVNSDALETGEGVHFTVVPMVEPGSETHCGSAKIVEAPQTDVAVGDFATMVVYGFGYKPGIKVCVEDGEWEIDTDGSFVELEKLSSSGYYTTYKLITKQICKAKPYFSLTNLGASVDPESVINVYDPEELFNIEPTEPYNHGLTHGGTKMLKAPDSELTVGQSTTMIIDGLVMDYNIPKMSISDENGGYIREWEEYFDIKEISRDENIVELEITAKKPCKAKPYVYLSLTGASEEYGAYINVTEAADSTAEVIRKPQTELAVGQETTLTLSGTGYIPTLRVLGGGDSFTYDMSGDFIKIEKVSSAGDTTTYRITPKKACRAELCFDRADRFDPDLPYFSFHIVEGAPVANAPEPAAGTSGVKGDANTDGKLDVADSVTVLQFIANQYKYPMSDRAKILADVDGVEGITGGDAAAIQKLDAGIF